MENNINIGTDELKSLISNILGIDKINTYLTIIDIFDSVGYNDYLYDVDSIVNVKDSVDSDPSTMVDNLTRVLKEHSVKYIKRYGIIIDEDKMYEPGLSFYGSLLLSLTSIPGMDISQAVYIDNVINSDELEDNTEILFNILQTFEPLLDLNMYYYIIDKVYDQLLDKISAMTKDKLNKTDDDIEDYEVSELLDSIIKLIDLFVKNNLPVTPSVLIEFMNNPVTLLTCIKSNNCSKKFKFLLNEYLRTTNNIVLDTPDLIEDTRASLLDIVFNYIVTSLLEGESLNNVILELGEYNNDITQQRLKYILDEVIDIVSKMFKEYELEKGINDIVKEYQKGNEDE